MIVLYTFQQYKILSLENSLLNFKVSRFLDDSGKTRFLVINRKTHSSPFCLSLYEHELSHNGNSPNSTSKILYELCYLYTWADINRVDIDILLLNGNGFSEANINKFIQWLREYVTREDSFLSHKVINSVITHCSIFCIWCGKWEANRPSGRNSSIINQTADNAIKFRWQNKTIRIRANNIAQDLTEEEISKIENALKPDFEIKNGVSEEIAYRNYLIWHLTIEFGLRISEILSLRLQDCPSYNRNYISVVRVNERGKNYQDPRGVYAPRPKTLSRDLGFVIHESILPKLIQTYISKYRFKKMSNGGKSFILDHDFLILAHNSGSPLSVVSAMNIAKNIKVTSGVDNFHWHISRHAFFNRAYSAVTDNESHINDLVYFGGWSDKNSLNTYIKRAIRNRSIQSLSVWQNGNKWEAITK